MYDEHMQCFIKHFKIKWKQSLGPTYYSWNAIWKIQNNAKFNKGENRINGKHNKMLTYSYSLPKIFINKTIKKSKRLLGLFQAHDGNSY